MFHLLIYITLFAVAQGHAKFMVCKAPKNQNPTATPVTAPITAAPFNKQISWMYPANQLNNATRATFTNNVYPGMSMYAMGYVAANYPPGTTTEANTLIPNGYSNNYTIEAVRSNGNVLSTNYTQYTPGEVLTVRLSSNWLRAVKGEVFFALEQTFVSGNAEFIGPSLGYLYGCNRTRYFLCAPIQCSTPTSCNSCGNLGPLNVSLVMPLGGRVKIMAGWALGRALNTQWAKSLILDFNVPTAKPTSLPSIVPTVKPTFNPSASPQTSMYPSTPTFTPSFKPSSTPTFVPTFSPTAKPSFKPTSTPTFDPTFSPTSFVPKTLVSIDQQLQNVDAASFQTPSGQDAFKTAVVNSLPPKGIQKSDIAITEVHVRVNQKAKMSLAVVSQTVTVSYTINSPTTVASSIVTDMKAAVDTGVFQTKLVDAATVGSVTGLQSAVVNVAPTVDVSSPTIAPTASTLSPTHPSLSQQSKNIAITVGCIGGFLLLCAVGYVSYKTGALMEKKNALDFYQKKGLNFNDVNLFQSGRTDSSRIELN